MSASRTGGGAGVSNSITGTAVTYASGGNNGYSTGTVGGAAGTANTGQGAGGPSSTGSTVDSNVVGANGGSGVVIIRYPDTSAPAISTTGLQSGYPVVSGGYRIYKWITSGSITF